MDREEKLKFAAYMRRHPTREEAMLWENLKERSIKNNRFVRQAYILGWIVDFYSPASSLVVEVDGPTHNKVKDKIRDETMRKYGLTILRFTNNHVLTNIKSVIAEISASCTKVELKPKPTKTPFSAYDFNAFNRRISSKK